MIPSPVRTAVFGCLPTKSLLSFNAQVEGDGMDVHDEYAAVRVGCGARGDYLGTLEGFGKERERFDDLVLET